MNKEIKEILEYLKNNTFIPGETKRKYKILHMDEVRKLLDYITNLQEENERLKAQNTRYEIKMNSLIQENNVLKENAEHNDKVVDKAKWNEMIYKSRCEKAIEYVEHHKFNKFGDIDCGEAEEIINILNGGDEEWK